MESFSNPEEISEILTNLGLEVEKISTFESVPVSVDANELTSRSNDYSIYMIVGIIVSAILVVIWRKKSS